MKRILIATIGSLGDLHPCLALALELKRRGHAVTIASTEFYRTRLEALGIVFHPIRPAWDPGDSALISQCENLKTGPEVLFRKLILPHIANTYQDLLTAAASADLLIAGELVFAAPLVAGKTGLPWVSAILSPCSFFSAHDPSLLMNMPALFRLRKAGWPLNRAALNLGRLATRHWWEPVRQLRREHGLSPDCDPLFRDKFSPDLVLALFSPVLAKPQPDWPRQTVQPGFVFHDSAATSPELTKFLSTGEPPIVFTLGSTAVHNPGSFYEVSAEAAKRLGRRAVLLGASPNPIFNSPEILAVPYAPYAQIFPHAAVIVHQGGSGTTGQALRAGRPTLIVPYGWDQPDNAARIERLGTGLSLQRRAYSVQMALSSLRALLENPSFGIKAAEVASQLQRDQGLTAACDAIESIPATSSRIVMAG